MKKIMVNLLIALFLLIPTQATESQDNDSDEFEIKYSTTYNPISWTLTEALIGRQVREIDENLRFRRQHHMPMDRPEAHDSEDDSDCLCLYYFCGMCFCIL